MISHIVCSGSFSNLRRIVIIGHSAGGQLVNRYAASSSLKLPDMAIRYISLNPSHYLYFSNERWNPGSTYSFSVPSGTTRNNLQECLDNDELFNSYNDYSYGPDNLWDYHDQLDITDSTLKSRYRIRDIVHLVGEDDNDPLDSTISRTCKAMLQGNTRLERGEVYFAYLQHVFGQRNNHAFEVVPTVGHSGHDMITSEECRRYIFEEFEPVDMKSIADYQLIRDSSFELSQGKDKEFEFSLPSDLITSGFSKSPFITFFSDPTKLAKNLRVLIEINGSEIFNYPYTGGVGRSHQEAFNHSHLLVGESNLLRFSVENGVGAIHISDIILWYQRSV